MCAEIILQSNCIFTSKSEPAFAGYVAIAQGKILAVAKGMPEEKYVNEKTKIYNLEDKTICPGFFDVHCFFTGWALGQIGYDLSDCTTAKEAVSNLSTLAQQLLPEKPIWAHGLEDTLVCEVTEQLQALYPTRACFVLAKSCEACAINSAGVDRYGFTSSTCYSEAMWRLLREMMQDTAFIKPLFTQYMQMLNAKGITSTKEMGFDDYYGFADILEELEQENSLTLRVNFMSQPVGAGADFAHGQAMSKRFNGEYVRFSGYNRMSDGSISQLCGDMKQPYLCAPNTCCAQEINWELITKETLFADKLGFRFSLHAQGDAAIQKVLDIYEKCQRDSEGRVINRHSITDLECSDPVDLERMGKMGVVAEIYPQIQSIANRSEKLAMIEEKIGLERGKNYWNRRKMVDSGVIVSCATDLPLLIDDIPESIYHGVGGYFPEGGEPFNKQNMLNREELLTAWCSGGAYNLYRENELGTLEVGKLADIAVFDANIFTTDMADIRNATVCLTILNGKVVHNTL